MDRPCCVTGGQNLLNICRILKRIFWVQMHWNTLVHVSNCLAVRVTLKSTLIKFWVSGGNTRI